ncbi:TRAP transporter small permease [Pelotomaculum terephthalicicum JT]|uniref:TRAP transporter small permease n=1 Tax=Pelotomaculum TaxID=191373 RepID=UPI0009CC7236|nr:MULTISPECIES: TRAP transporter small permease [Pelotomaculum]MCG9968196.1 TRAP transporter small permease [Pelotomaculum terephthalicicum JT]OPX83909.1 MAG: 2,3-diketo-L-gulonate TRAP transporter small permease protein YiaM [Pelotomaculum sp. PtaB.Bin117]OPY58523.1 MAG: 2,3-diketo-L-gulonate TRAP transporter small permease protein YiaM [Pelotomaculum sp. PtaU1.Bin065]
MGIFRILQKTPGFIAGIFLGVSTFIVAINAVLRYGFSHALPWIDELSILLIVMLIFIIQIQLEAKNDQLSIDVIDSFLKKHPVIKRIFGVIRWALTITLYFMIVKAGLGIIQQNYELKSATPILEWPQYLLFAIVAACMTLTIITCIVNLAREFSPGKRS